MYHFQNSLGIKGGKKKCRYLASRLVKSSDSHANDPCSRLGGSSWLCYGIISLQSSMKCHLLVAPPCCQRANSKVLGPAVYKNIAEFNEIENSSPYNGEDEAD